MSFATASPITESVRSVYLIDLPKAMRLRLPNRRWRWLAPASLRQFPVSSMTFKAAKILANHEKNFS